MKTTFLRLILPVLLLVCFTSCDEEKGQEQMESSSSLKWESCAGIQLGKGYSLLMSRLKVRRTRWFAQMQW